MPTQEEKKSKLEEEQTRGNKDNKALVRLLVVLGELGDGMNDGCQTSPLDG